MIYERDCREKQSRFFYFFYRERDFFCVENRLKNALKNLKKHVFF